MSYHDLTLTGAELDTALGKAHAQNTDTGTTSEAFQIDSGDSGPKIKNVSGTLSIRNQADNADAPVKTSKAETLEIQSSDDLKITCGANKTLELQAPVWDDIRTPVNSVKLDSVKTPTEVSYKGGQALSFASNTNNKMYFNVQLPHNYKLGTNLEFHIHIVLPVAGGGIAVENVKFIFTYSWAKIGAVFPDESSPDATRNVQNDAADKHILMQIEDIIDGSGIDGVSSMLVCSLERDVSVANDYASAVYLLEVDFHYQIDTLGSRQETVK